jgi:hypothetical protein
MKYKNLKKKPEENPKKNHKFQKNSKITKVSKKYLMENLGIPKKITAKVQNKRMTIKIY